MKGGAGWRRSADADCSEGLAEERSNSREEGEKARRREEKEGEGVAGGGLARGRLSANC